MIGFDGTCLPTASLGEYHITTAAIGGQLVMKTWLLSATKQAIIAAFGAEGTEVIAKTNDYLNAIAITDTARAQQLSAFINEDPMLIVSLVEVGKVRYIVGPNDASNYFTLPWCNTNKTEIEMEFAVERTDNWVLLSTGQTRIFALSNNTYAGWGTNRVQYSYPYVIGTKYVGLFNSTSLKVNGVSIGGVGSSYGSNKMYIGHDYQNNGIANNIDIISLKWKEDGVQVGWFVPFIRNEQVELLDLVSGSIATRSGTFTIEITDKA